MIRGQDLHPCFAVHLNIWEKNCCLFTLGCPSASPSELPTEADTDDFTVGVMELNDDDEDEQEENEEEVVVDQDYYYDSYKDYNEEPPSAPSKERTFSEKEIMNDVKGNRSHYSFSQLLSVATIIT